jgi:hypothetical protein
MPTIERKYPTGNGGAMQPAETPKTPLFNITYTDDKSEQKTKTLLIGVSGTGRSTFASTYPSPLWINADYGLRTPFIRAKHQPKIDLQFGTVEKLPQHRTHRVLDFIYLALKNGDYKSMELEKMPETIIIDTVTSVSYFMEKEVCLWPEVVKKERSDDEFMQLQDYGHVQRRIHNVIALYGSLPINLICIFNPKLIDIDGMPGQHYAPAVTGNAFSPGIPHLFDEVYWFDVDDGKPESERYFFTRVKSKKFPYAKTKCADMPEVVYNPTYDKIKNALLGKKVKQDA